MKVSDVLGSKWTFISFSLLIILLGVALRSQTLRFGTLMEPDEYFHLRTVEYILQTGQTIPKTLNFSGYPIHSIVLEPITFYWLVIAVSKISGISLFDVFLYLPIVFGALYIILSGLIARELKNSRFFILLTMLLVSTSVANMIRTVGGELRGDTIAPLFLLLAIFIANRLLGKNSHRLLYSIVLGFVISLSYLAWRGGIFVPAVFLLFDALFIFVNYWRGSSKALSGSLYIAFALIVFAFLAEFYYFEGLITVTNPLMSGVFTPVSVMVFAVSVMVFNRLGRQKHERRIMYSLIFIAVFFAVLALAYLIFNSKVPPLYDSLNLVNNRIFAVVSELRPANLGTANLLGFSLLSPLGILFLISIATGGFRFIFVLPLALCALLCLFMKSEGGRYAVRFESSPIWLLVIAYVMTTMLMTLIAVRFIYLLSIPLSIVTAYTVYWLYGYSKGRNISNLARFSIAVIIIFSPIVGYLSAYSMFPADFSTGLNEGLLWISNNTPQNSVVLTSWWDGSFVEGIADRTSVIDSVGAQNVNSVYLFSDWLYANYTNSSLFAQMGDPNYLLVEYNWTLSYNAFGYPIYKNYSFPESSNMYALLHSCAETCQVDSNSIHFELVYGNNDSLIYQINYTQSCLVARNTET